MKIKEKNLVEVLWLNKDQSRFAEPSMKNDDGSIFFLFDDPKYYHEGDLLWTILGIYQVINVPDVKTTKCANYVRRTF